MTFSENVDRSIFLKKTISIKNLLKLKKNRTDSFSGNSNSVTFQRFFFWPVLSVKNVVFCNTSLPLASTRWDLLTLSSLCTLFQALPSINISNIKKKIIGNAKNQTQGCWVRSKYVTCVLSSTPRIEILLQKSAQTQG